jgi:tetratricopeptide (TPR) repeat protein
VRFASAAVALRSQSSGPRLALAHALYDQGRLEDAVTELRQAISLDPSSAILHHNLALTLKEQKKVTEAIGEFRKAIELDPQLAYPHYNLGLLLEELGKLDEAMAEYRKATEIDPKNADALTNLGNALDIQGKQDEAIAKYRQAIALDPKHAMAHYNLGYVFHMRDQWAAAAAEYRTSIDLNPRYFKAHGGLGSILYLQGNLPGAEKELREAVRLEPSSAISHSNLGLVLAARGEFVEAEAEHREALRLQPDYGDGYSHLGAFLCDYRHDYEGAIAAFRKALTLKPSSPAMVHDNLAIAYSKSLQFDRATAEFALALALSPKDAKVHNDLAWCLATWPDPKHRDPRRAVELARKAVELMPHYGGFWNTLGVACYRTGAWKEAIDALQKSTKLGAGGDAGDWFFLAMSHWQTGNKEEARKWYERAAQWMQKNQPKDADLQRFHAEAAELLGEIRKKD